MILYHISSVVDVGVHPSKVWLRGEYARNACPKCLNIPYAKRSLPLHVVLEDGEEPQGPIVGLWRAHVLLMRSDVVALLDGLMSHFTLGTVRIHEPRPDYVSVIAQQEAVIPEVRESDVECVVCPICSRELVRGVVHNTFIRAEDVPIGDVFLNACSISLIVTERALHRLQRIANEFHVTEVRCV
jgi:hypothetical protein